MQTLSLAGMLKGIVKEEAVSKERLTNGVICANILTMISELLKTSSDKNVVCKQFTFGNLAQYI